MKSKEIITRPLNWTIEKYHEIEFILLELNIVDPTITRYCYMDICKNIKHETWSKDDVTNSLNIFNSKF